MTTIALKLAKLNGMPIFLGITRKHFQDSKLVSLQNKNLRLTKGNKHLKKGVRGVGRMTSEGCVSPLSFFVSGSIFLLLSTCPYSPSLECTSTFLFKNKAF